MMEPARARRLGRMAGHLTHGHCGAGSSAAAERSLVRANKERLSSWAGGDPVVYSQQLEGDGRPGVSAAEAAFFREHGFLVKRGLVRKEALQPGVEVKP